jgi:enoyl-CoA hydratase/carnithine racemase
MSTKQINSPSNEESEIYTKHVQLIKKSPSHWEISFNRPEKYNAITSEMYERITQIVNQASKDEQLVLLTITGNGKYYSSGTDLADPAKSFVSRFFLYFICKISIE